MERVLHQAILLVVFLAILAVIGSAEQLTSLCFKASKYVKDVVKEPASSFAYEPRHSLPPIEETLSRLVPVARELQVLGQNPKSQSAPAVRVPVNFIQNKEKKPALAKKEKTAEELYQDFLARGRYSKVRSILR